MLMNNGKTRYALLCTSALIALGLTTSGCPNAPGGSEEATLTVSNQLNQFSITNIRLIAPGESVPGANLLSGPVATGSGVDITVTAPNAEDNPDGTSWTIIASGQLQVRAKQDDPNDQRALLNNNFDDVDTSDNEELSFEEVQAAYPDFSIYDFNVLDLDGDEFVERGEVNTFLRLAIATFTCVHEGDQLVWNFDGDSPADICDDAS